MANGETWVLALPKWIVATAAVAALVVVTVFVGFIIYALSAQKTLHAGVLGEIGWGPETSIDALGWADTPNDTKPFDPSCEYKIVINAAAFTDQFKGWGKLPGKQDGEGSVIYPSLVAPSLLSVDWTLSLHPAAQSEHFSVDSAGKGMMLLEGQKAATVQVKQRCGPVTLKG